MHRRSSGPRGALLLLIPALLIGTVATASAEALVPVTMSGTISYFGSSEGDSLYVAAIDTAGAEDVTLLDLQVIAVGSPPFDQPYTLQFDNSGVINMFIAAFLDVDGGGIDEIGSSDVFGWYAGSASPAPIAPIGSQSGLDFDLPRAEIHGTVTLAAGQAEARVDFTTDLSCMTEGFRPGSFVFSSGPYAIIGVYPGTYCVNATGFAAGSDRRVCHGDPSCTTPTPITLTETEVKSGVDLDFSGITPIDRTSWGRVKAQFR